MEGKLRNCLRCGKLFMYTGQRICRDCLRKENEQFDLVKDYIHQNPEANIMQVSKDTGVPIARITEFLREGRLHLAERSGNLSIECEICGARISHGRLCDKCARKLERETDRAFAGKEPEENPRRVKKRGQKGRLFIRDRLVDH